MPYTDGQGVTQVSSGGLIIGGAGSDTIDVGTVARGNFIVIGGGTANETPGNDFIQGGFGDDLLIAGNAILVGASYQPDMASGGKDTVLGGPGNDTIFGGAASDVLIGGGLLTSNDAGVNTIHGGDGGNYIITGNATTQGIGALFLPDYSTPGSGQVDAGAGNDVIYGASGNRSQGHSVRLSSLARPWGSQPVGSTWSGIAAGTSPTASGAFSGF